MRGKGGSGKFARASAVPVVVLEMPVTTAAVPVE
jgi:hypothetical protein